MIYHAHEFGPEHDHLFVGNAMKYKVSYIVQRFKGYSSKRIRQECWDEIKDKLWGDSFWHDGYFYEYIGRFTNESMRYYVERQHEKHWNNEDYDYHKYKQEQQEKKGRHTVRPLTLADLM